MKNLLLIGLLLISVSCGSRTDKKAAAEERAAATTDTSALGPETERVYEGLLPAADGPGIRYRLVLHNREHSGDGTFALTMTYLEAENGKDESFDSEGKWGTLRGSKDDPNATVYQLNIGEPDKAMNFLYLKDSLVMLNDSLERAVSPLNYTLKLVGEK